MIHFKIGKKRDIRPDEHDEMNRAWIGWEPYMDPQAIYEQNRGTWILGRRADAERYAVFSDTVEREIRCVVEISHIETTGRKRAVVGTVLGPGHPVHDALIGQEPPNDYRNPVTYAPDPGT